jgi:hypothetical protein
MSIRFAAPVLGALVGLACAVADARAAVLTLTFSGTVSSVADNGPVAFAPAPVGSPFSGSITYNGDALSSNAGPGFSQYANLSPDGATLTLNGSTFTATTGSAFAEVVSQAANAGFSGVRFKLQPIAVPAGWSVATPAAPSLTLDFRDPAPQARAMKLPTSTAEFPSGPNSLFLAFEQRVTVNGQTYGSSSLRLAGTIASFAVTGVPEPSATAFVATAAGWCAARRRRRRRHSLPSLRSTSGVHRAIYLLQ